MATLVLAGHPALGSTDAAGAASLSEWLQDDWAILFSHPDDFVRCELESDRWVTVTQSAFAAARARPLALARPYRPLDCGWVSRVNGGARLVPLGGDARLAPRRGPAGRWIDLADFHAHRLQEDIEAMSERFVMIIDASLKRRRTYAYGAPEGLPSPLDFLRWVRALRDTRVPQGPPADSRLGYGPGGPRRYWPEAFQSQSAA